MILTDQLFKPRKLPGWWLRFTEANPIVPNLIAVIGLAWICYSLAILINASAKDGHGEIIKTLGLVSGSKPLIEKAINFRNAYHDLIPADIRNLVASLYGNLPLYLVVPFLLFLEFLFPANSSQPLIGKGFFQDAIWYVIYTPIMILIIYPFVALLRTLFEQNLGSITLKSAIAWPVYIQIIAALLLADFYVWLNHFVRHKVRPLWLFHAVHHSQKELNVFTDNRAHIVDLLLQSLLMFVPFLIFNVSSLYAVTVIGIYKPIHNRFVHANVKINLGWLGWLVTSPQFHRVHHSVEQVHTDKNFGVLFSIYDHLFGTACKDRHVYPETGIADARFPTEDKVRLAWVPGNLFAQIAYPFKQIFEDFQPPTIQLKSWLSGLRSRITKNMAEPDNIVKQDEPPSEPRTVKHLM